MFGYIRPFIPELKVKDKELYQAYYCGLCRALRKYGMTSRMTLTYDATFAAILLSSVLNDEPELVPPRLPGASRPRQDIHRKARRRARLLRRGIRAARQA